MPVETLARPQFLLFFLPGRWLLSECPSRVLSAVVTFRTQHSLPDPVPSPAVLVRQAVHTLPEAVDCYENLCHINRNKTRTLADPSASKCQQLFSSNLWNTIASAQPCDWEDHLVRMIPLHCGWHHAQVPQADLPHLLISKTPTPMYSDMAV